MKNKNLMVLLVYVMILSLLVMPVYAAKPVSDRTVDTVVESVDPADNLVTDLVTEKGMIVGEVFINKGVQEDSYEVRYLITEEGWYLTEVHFEAISEGDFDYISNKGTLIPGKFTEKASFELIDEQTEYEFLYKAGATVADFAAHAVVVQKEVSHIENEEVVIVSDEDTLWGEDDNSVVLVPHSAWETHIDIEDASWIWDSNVFSGEIDKIVDFKRVFNIKGNPTFAELTITADNEYVGSFNGGTEFSDEDWTSAETIDVIDDVQSGDNILNIAVTNTGSSSTGSNPGGLIYRLVIESEWTKIDVPEVTKSVWGDGYDAGTRNWSMLIPNEGIGCNWQYLETVTVDADEDDSTPSVNTMESGTKYKLIASGTAYAGDSIEFDVKYSITNVPAGDTWTDDVTRYTSYGTDLLDLKVDDDFVDWGAYDDSHVYELIITGDGSPLDFQIYDIYYPNNTGYLTVEIYECEW